MKGIYIGYLHFEARISIISLVTSLGKAHPLVGSGVSYELSRDVFVAVTWTSVQFYDEQTSLMRPFTAFYVFNLSK